MASAYRDRTRTAQREADRIIAATVREPDKPDTLTRRIDSVLLHPVIGLVILLAVMFVMFQAVFSWAQPVMNLISGLFDLLAATAHATIPAGLLQSFIENGVISGVGSVIVFLPQILILFLFILLLEDFGYMSRAAFLMDRIMGKWDCTDGPSFRCCRVSPAPSPESWRRG